MPAEQGLRSHQRADRAPSTMVGLPRRGCADDHHRVGHRHEHRIRSWDAGADMTGDQARHRIHGRCIGYRRHQSTALRGQDRGQRSTADRGDGARPSPRHRARRSRVATVDLPVRPGCQHDVTCARTHPGLLDGLDRAGGATGRYAADSIREREPVHRALGETPSAVV